MKKGLFRLLVMTLASSLWLSSAVAMTKQTFSPIEMKQLNTAVITAFNNNYIYRDKSKELAKQLTFKTYSGNFNAAMSVESYVDTISTEIRGVTGDNTISLTFSFSQQQTKQASINTEHFNEKISYVGLEGDFTSPQLIKELRHSIGNLQQAQTLILDLREVGAMDKENFTALASLFTPEKAELGQIQYYGSNKLLLSVNSSYTVNNQTALVIINSSFISGYWELFSLAMQRIRNAVIVGQDTMGITELSKTVKLPYGLELTMPHAIINNIDGEPNWQGVGVAAEHYANSENTLETAVKIALKM